MAWPTTSRQSRGYGAEHDRIRKHLLHVEPLCRECAKQGRTELATIADHVIPLSKGGKTELTNYQPLCRPCSAAKTAADEGRTVKPKLTIGNDGWPA